VAYPSAIVTTGVSTHYVLAFNCPIHILKYCTVHQRLIIHCTLSKTHWMLDSEKDSCMCTADHNNSSLYLLALLCLPVIVAAYLTFLIHQKPSFVCNNHHSVKQAIVQEAQLARNLKEIRPEQNKQMQSKQTNVSPSAYLWQYQIYMHACLLHA